ncbi:ADP-heptose--lipopolysaccharide heptosyltransferase [Citrifermentans bemidjiense Bem]|uniref:Lipopolysaccharide heptosyltransferase 1 n=1 Tax=Citrifermentans bemidjiense (strain ATCC BAA-1014 / DSM 16622 / JCM 12645 / Bem) TaxID=404380 RepID=B5EEX8_CITBB|nr:lipopolysaccharide heptosyltransferase I [Citrifermentans bemidjiense]ACH37874.1 ADP-heptose--lipopolysaccharide heptosyltransferase [Citrifermentans bemidjiense Bem]
MRVLIIKASALGDIISALPVLDYLRQASPGIEIDWVVEEPFRELLEGNPLIAQLHTVRTKAWRKRPFLPAHWSEVARLKEALREREYAFVFDIQGNLKSGLICWLSGGADRIGFDSGELQESVNSLFTTRRIPMRRQDYHVTQKCLRLVSVPFGKDFSQMTLRSSIATSAEDDANAEALLATLSDGLVFLFQYGTTWQTKFWSKKSWVALGREVLEQFPDASILFPWGNEGERAAVAGIAAEIGAGSRVLDRYSLKGLTALLKKVDLVVGGDTGPVHLAAAVGTPTVSFYRASDGKRSGPLGERHVVLQSPMHCTKCFRTKCDKDAQCSDSIKVEAVLAGIKKLLA